MRQYKVTLASAVAALAVSAAPQALAEDVKLGVLLAYTGPLEAMAPPIGDAAQLVAEHVNGQGGIQGGSLEFVVGDDTCVDATAASNAADRLVNTDGITAMVGAMCSGVTIAVANTVAVPEDGKMSPESNFSVVVFPAPLGPRKATISPGWI